MSIKHVITPNNLGRTVKLGAIEAKKWDVFVDESYFEFTDDGIILKDTVLEPLRQADIASGSLVGSNLELTKVDGSKIRVPLTSLVPASKADRFLQSVTYDPATTKLKFVVANDMDSDTTNLEVSVADLLPVVSGDGLIGDGTSANPIKIKIKAGEPFVVTSQGLAFDKTSDALVKLTDGTGNVALGYALKI